MQFIDIQGELVNLELVRSIRKGNKVIVISFNNDDYVRPEYANDADTAIAFSQMKMQIDTIQGGVK